MNLKSSDDERLPRVLDAFDQALSVKSPRYDALIACFRALEVAGAVSKSNLRRVYDVCYRVLGIYTPTAGPPADLSELPNWQAEHLRACASEQIEQTLYDRNADNWASLQRQLANCRPQARAGLEETAARLPEPLHVPWCRQEVEDLLHPYLSALETRLAQNPSCHFKLCRDVHDSGYQVFRGVIDVSRLPYSAKTRSNIEDWLRSNDIL